jgi:S-disulfanyl-L-cysteine oxidoreductase SoxD
MDDVRKTIYGTIIGFLAVVVLWIGIVYINACGFTYTCHRGDLKVERTPIPTLVPATLPAINENVSGAAFNKCKVATVNLIAAWVSAGYSETEPFTFTDADGVTCQATFKKDVQRLFLEGNLWYPGALACATCHNSNVATATANMDLSSYQGMLMGSRRTDPNAKGNDIFGGGVWDQSKLHEMLFVKKMMPLGRPPDVPAEGPIVYAGQPTTSAPVETTIQEATATAQAPVAAITTTESAPVEIARPSNPGGPGKAISLTGDAVAGMQVFNSTCITCHGEQGVGGKPNPGSTDGTVPPLNPIDSTLVDTNHKTFATNMDLFIEHGSTPEGTNPVLKMPAWGDTNALTSQQVADVIAYIISLNEGNAPTAIVAASPTSAPAQPAATTASGTGEIARPSNPGGPGQAVELTGNIDIGKVIFNTNCVTCHGSDAKGGNPNPGSDDGTVPALNPIDSTMVSPDYKTFTTNIDLFIEHGSTPAGTNPVLSMPAWGDQKLLQPQNIADVIAYIISLNK